MAVANSKIEWTDATWSPLTGCTKVSPGCDHCYAETLHERFNGKGSFATVTLRPERLDQPIRWKKPRRIFVNSMSDLFHKDVPDEFIAQVFAVMALAPQHTFQLLTKRHARMRTLLNDPAFEPQVREIAREMKCGGGQADPRMNDQNYQTWPLPNLWLGVSVEDQKWADIRIPALLETPAAVRWISAEPLLGHIDLRNYFDHTGHDTDAAWDTWSRACMVCADHPDSEQFDEIEIIARTGIGLDWVVVGGESGPGARLMHPDWARTIRNHCSRAGVPFLFKQWGAWAPTGMIGTGVFHDSTPAGYLRQPVRLDPNRCYAGAPFTIHRTEAGTEISFSPEMVRVGKKAAGRALDEAVHDGYPAVTR